MIKAVAFDLGNVVLSSDFAYNTPEELTEFCNSLGVTMDNMDTAFSVCFPPFSLGQMTENEYWEKYLYVSRATNPDIEKAKQLFRTNQKENENMTTLARSLKGKYKVAALTTIPREWLEFKKEKFNLDSCFDFIVSSGYEGVSKPNPEIYQRLVERFEVAPEEIVFVDDKEPLLTPAKELGINTIVFRGEEDLKLQLEKVLS